MTIQNVRFSSIYSCPPVPILRETKGALEPFLKNNPDFQKTSPERQKEMMAEAMDVAKKNYLAIQNDLFARTLGEKADELKKHDEYMCVGLIPVVKDEVSIDQTQIKSFFLTGDDLKAVLELIKARQEKLEVLNIQDPRFSSIYRCAPRPILQESKAAMESFLAKQLDFQQQSPEKQQEMRDKAMDVVKKGYIAMQKRTLGAKMDDYKTDDEYLYIGITPVVKDEAFIDQGQTKSFFLTGDDKKAVLDLIEARLKKA